MTTTQIETERAPAIRQEFTFAASPERVYDLLTSATQFSAATGAPAHIDATPGAPFSLFGGNIHGAQIELLPGRRIVQAWRGAQWDEGVYSVVRLTLTPEGAGVKLTLHQDGYPEGPSPLYATWREHLDANWSVFYFQPLARYLAAVLV